MGASTAASVTRRLGSPGIASTGARCPARDRCTRLNELSQMAYATVAIKSCSKCRTCRSILVSTSAGSSLSSAYARTAVRRRPIAIAAGNPRPTTSPMAMHTRPEGRGKTSYQSPLIPRFSAGTYREPKSRPEICGSSAGSRERCSAVAALRSVVVSWLYTCTAMRSAATRNHWTSSSSNSRSRSVPVWRMPSNFPSASSGTPTSVRSPFRHRSGLTTVLELTSLRR